MDKKLAENKANDRVRARLGEPRVNACIIGIDPGLSGALAVVDSAGKLLEAFSMPSKTKIVARVQKRAYDAAALLELVLAMKAKYNIVCAAVERVAASPQMGVSSAFSFGHGYGLIRGILEATDIKVILVEPTVWKRRAGLAGRDKKASVAKALAVFKVPFKKEGQAEAALIAWHVLNEADALS